MNLLEFMWTDRSEILHLSAEHVFLVFVAIMIAIVIGVPLGILMTRRAGLGKSILAFANIIQTIPSLALFGFLIPVPYIGGIGTRTAVIALLLYSLLPIVRNTYTGILGVDAAVREAALGMGMTNSQILWQVEIPLSLGVIFAGVRVATVIAVGVATIAAAIGAGGLGMFIFRGTSMLDYRVILAGAIPAALIALAADFGMSTLERHFMRERRS